MKSEIHIIHGKGSLKDKRDHVLGHLNKERTLILLPEIDNYGEYEGFNRNIQIGLSRYDLNLDLLNEHETVIVEPYDYLDFKAFFASTHLLYDFLHTNNNKMYVICNREKDVKLRSVTDGVEMRKEHLEEVRENNPRLKDIVLTRKS